MDLHYQREITVGTLVLAGIGLFIGGTLWLKGATLRSPGRTEQVRFTDTGGLQVDNEVRVSGYPVGKVTLVDGSAGDAFLEINAEPTASLARLHEVLLVFAGSGTPPTPVPATEPAPVPAPTPEPAAPVTDPTDPAAAAPAASPATPAETTQEVAE